MQQPPNWKSRRRRWIAFLFGVIVVYFRRLLYLQSTVVVLLNDDSDRRQNDGTILPSNVTIASPMHASRLSSFLSSFTSNLSSNENMIHMHTASEESDTGTGVLSSDVVVSQEQQHPSFHVNFPLCLIHVGKTAGSTISCGLGLFYADCEGPPRDRLSQGVYYHHLKRNTCFNHRSSPPAVSPVNEERSKEQTIQTYIMTIRNPLTRWQSWFDFEKDIRPQRRNKQEERRIQQKRDLLFVDCYSNFTSLVQEGLRPLPPAENGTTTDTTGSNGQYKNATTPVLIENKTPKSMTCSERGWSAALGTRAFSYHEWYNYEYYWSVWKDQLDVASKTKFPQHNDDVESTDESGHKTVADQEEQNRAPFFVLRTEHLLDDWRTVSTEPLFRPVNRGQRGSHPRAEEEELLPGGEEEKSSSASRIHNNKTSLASLSISAREQLCQALCPEIQIYKEILQRADNLQESQRLTSMQEVKEICPLEDGMEVRPCPGIPVFPLLEVGKQQFKMEPKKRLFKTKEK